MFTGIIQVLGRVGSFEPASGGARLIAEPLKPFDNLTIGESIAVEGVCLTAEPNSNPSRLGFFLSQETLDRTTLNRLGRGQCVNLERSLAVGDRLGGHFVMGHVDAVGEIARLERLGEGWELEVCFPPLMRRYLAPKGSVAVDGISLTVAKLHPQSFSVALIPHSHDATSLREKRAGSAVNLEADVIARYVAEQLSGGEAVGGATADLLKRAGFGQAE